MAGAIKVLIIDDSRTLREQVSFTLKRNGFEVLEAENGELGLAKLKEHPDTKMVIMDVNMPVLNGWETLKKIKAHLNSEIARIPVLMLTTETEAASIAQAQQLGAKAWLTKPFHPDSLVSAVKKLTAG